MKNYTRIMEMFWLIVAIGTAIFAGKIIYTTGANNETLLFLFPPFIALGMWYVRRRYRKKSENN